MTDSAPGMNECSVSNLENKLGNVRIDFDRTIQLELEHLNKSSSEINAFESRLEAERASYTDLYSQSQRETSALSEKLRKSIEKARPYFEAKFLAKEANIEAQKAAWRYERACSVEEAAKEMVNIAEQTYFSKNEKFGTEWQDTLNAAIVKVNEAETERIAAETEHQQTMLVYREAEQRVVEMSRSLRKHIESAEAYFDAVEQYGEELAERKSAIERLERDVAMRKREYAIALHHLELISNELHRRRAEEAGVQANQTAETDQNDSLPPGDAHAHSTARPSSQNGREVCRSESLTSVSTSSSTQSAVNRQASNGDPQPLAEAPERRRIASSEAGRVKTTGDAELLSNRPSSFGGSQCAKQQPCTAAHRASVDTSGKSLALPTVDLLKTSLQHSAQSYVSYEKRVAFERQLFAATGTRVENSTNATTKTTNVRCSTSATDAKSDTASTRSRAEQKQAEEARKKPSAGASEQR